MPSRAMPQCQSWLLGGKLKRGDYSDKVRQTGGIEAAATAYGICRAAPLDGVGRASGHALLQGMYPLRHRDQRVGVEAERVDPAAHQKLRELGII